MKKVKHPTMLFKLSSFLLTLLLLIFSNTLIAQDEPAEEVVETIVDLGGDPVAGKQLFNSNCAACHQLDRKGVGPALRGVAEKYEKDWLYSWIRNSQAMVQAGDPVAVALVDEWNQSVMQAFPQLSDTDIDNILAYTSQPKTEPAVAANGGTVDTKGSQGGISNNLVLGILVVVMLMMVVMLLLVNNVLKKIAAANNVVYPEKEKSTPIWKPFIQN